MKSITALLACSVLTAVTIQAQPHALDDVLRRAAGYHKAWTKQASGVSLEEQMQLMDVSGERTHAIVRISSDVVLVNVNEPTSALQFIAAANQPRLKYKLDGRKTLNNVPVVGV